MTSLSDDPDTLLNEWLGELDNLIGGLDAPNAHQRPASNSGPGLNASAATASAATAAPPVVQLRRPQSLLPAGARSSFQSNATVSSATSSYRFSMANLEETHEAELDAILGELSMLEQQKTGATAALSLTTMAGSTTGHPQTMHGLHMHQSQQQHQQQQLQQQQHQHHRGHSRTNSMLSHVTNSTISSVSTSSESGNGSGSESGGSGINGSSGSGSAALREPHRTESPDNDSAFSDTVSLMSSESSASSGGLSHHHHMLQMQQHQQQQHLLAATCDSAKAAKIHLALQKLEQASVRRLFVKAFTTDGASKSLLVDERMTCAHVTRLLADKNHVQMEPHWALVEQLPDLQMERLFEDHELLVDNLMNWRSDSKNRVLFVQRPDKVSLFQVPERYLPGTQMAPGSDHDENTRAMLLDEFFAAGHPISMEGVLFLKPDAKKAWKRHHFVLRASGLYYFPKEKTKSAKDLVCLALFADHDVYRGCGWKKKHKAPGDHTFALKQPRDNGTGTGGKDKPAVPKLLCAEDADTLDRWLCAIRVAKYGRRLLDAQRQLVDDLQREELERFSAHRCGSIGSIVSAVPSQCSSTGSVGSGAAASAAALAAAASGGGIASGGRLSRASSSSSSGCLSDETSSAAGFDSEFPTGTIKRKPSMKPNLPLTSMTRQLKEVGETTMQAVGAASSADGDEDGAAAGGSAPTSPERGGTLTRRHSRRRSEEASSNSGTLKRRPAATVAATGTTVASMHRGSVDSMGSSSTTSTPTGSAPGTPVQGSSAAAAAAAAQHLLLSNTINNNTQQQQQQQQQHYHNNHHLHLQHHLLQQPHNNHHLQQQHQNHQNHPHHHLHHLAGSSPLEIMPASMTDSTFSLPPPPPPTSGLDQLDNCSMSGSTLSLESLPPPPPPCDLQHLQTEFSASQTSLVSLPPPPPEIRPMCYLSGAAGAIHARATVDTIHPVTHFIVPATEGLPSSSPSTPPSQQVIYAKSAKQPASIIKAPPYKAPPPYNNNSPAMAATTTTATGDSCASSGTSTIGKSVTFADSPVLLRRKQVCFEDQVYTSPRRPSATSSAAAAAATSPPPPPPSCLTVEPLYVSSAPPPPPRADGTRLSAAIASPSLSHTSPKRLSDSQANPPPHFLKDLQRVMRKKWQVAQKCKLEPATTPHEVLGFRDFNGELVGAAAGGAHFYRETSNVSNWVQEHYGAGDVGMMPDDGLYENLGADGLGGAGAEMAMPPMMMGNKLLLNKRPPPPPPKRSLSTQLSTQQLRS